MGDVIDLRKVSDSANGMGEQAEVIKAKIKEVEALVEKYVASGAGVWDGESAAAYRNNFNKVVETVGSLCDASIALSNNNILMKLQIPNTIAHSIDILNSLNITLKISFISI